MTGGGGSAFLAIIQKKAPCQRGDHIHISCASTQLFSLFLLIYFLGLKNYENVNNFPHYIRLGL